MDGSVFDRCNQCNAHVKSQHSLNRHVKRVHERKQGGGEPGHECAECGKKFFEREDLTKHVARHAKQGKKEIDWKQIQLIYRVTIQLVQTLPLILI